MKIIRNITNTVSCLGIVGAMKYRIALELKKHNISLLKGRIWKFRAKKRNFHFFVRPFESDLFLIRECILGSDMNGDGEYDVPEMEKIFKNRNEVKYIIDAGANIGLFTLLVANKYKNAKIIAIEPEKKNYEILKKNCVQYSNIVCVNSGIWSENCRLTLINPGCESMSFRFKKTDDSEGIKAYDILTLMSDNHFEWIDILKMDIEGSEFEVFSRNNGWIDTTKLLLIETHDRYVPGCTELVNKLLSERNYSHSKKGENIVYYKNDKLI